MLAFSTACAALDVLVAQALARQGACLFCHSVYLRKIGPAWKVAAAMYHGEPAADQRPRSHVMTRREARFGDGHEAGHPVVKTGDPGCINKLLNWTRSPRESGRGSGFDVDSRQRIDESVCGCTDQLRGTAGAG